MKKLIVSDIDGTLLNGSDDVRDDFFEYIRGLKKRGITFVAASGRQLPSLKMLFEPVKDDIIMISENGAYVYEAGEIIYEKDLKKDVAVQIIGDVCKSSYLPIVSTPECVYVTEEFDKIFRSIHSKLLYKTQITQDPFKVKEDIMKVTAFCRDGFPKDVVESFVARWKAVAECTMSNVFYMDFMSPGVSKGKALGMVMDRLGVSADECVVFGDNYNDISMFKSVPESYVMDHADDSVKTYAKYETSSVYDTVYTLFGKV